MSENIKNISEGRGIGVGYVTLIMLFAVICLTVLASLSYEAARANDKLNEKSISFTNGLYSADSRAKVIVSQLDEAALLSHESGFFDDSFPLFCQDNPEISVVKIQEGYRVSFSENISGNLKLSVGVVFFSVPQDGQRYCVEEWKTVADTGDNENDTLGVWDGSFPGQA